MTPTAASTARQQQFHRIALAIFMALAIALAWSASARAGNINVDGSGLAIKGYDPVAYFTQNAAVPGNAEITATHKGATYRFASAEHRDLFIAAPDKYAPQYGGYCAYGVAKGVKARIEPEQFTVLDGKLYLNFNAGVQRTWQKDVPGYLAMSDKNWQHLGAE